jgi:large subunit ribosomal protein L15
MRLNELAPANGSTKSRKRRGRGPGSKKGKTSCRGHKGHNSRSGGGVRPGFEGGQMPIHRRLPKRGFTNIFKKKVLIINIRDLNRFESNDVIDKASLKRVGLIKTEKYIVKVLGNGDISFPIILKDCCTSKTAKEKIEASGGKIEV